MTDVFPISELTMALLFLAGVITLLRSAGRPAVRLARPERAARRASAALFDRRMDDAGFPSGAVC